MINKIKMTLCASAFALATLGVAAPAIADEVTLSGASCFPIGSPPSVPFEALVEAINEQGKGIVQIDLKGGAPAIGSPFTLTQKMSKGIYDIVGCPDTYFGNVLEEAAVLRLFERPFAELRENGGFDYIQGLMAKKGIHFIGYYHNFGPFYLWLAEKIDTPDLTGLNLRVSPIYTAFFQSLGATTQTSNIAQIYTYMENGTVQGFGWPGLGFVPSWTKVTKYRVEPGFYSSPLHAMVNQTKWESLTDEQRNFLTNIVLEWEVKSEASGEAFQARWQAQKDKTAAEGLTAITFTGADAEKWSKAARDAAWAEVLERSPEHGPKLMELFTVN